MTVYLGPTFLGLIRFCMHKAAFTADIEMINDSLVFCSCTEQKSKLYDLILKAFVYMYMYYVIAVKIFVAEGLLTVPALTWFLWF